MPPLGYRERQEENVMEAANKAEYDLLSAHINEIDRQVATYIGFALAGAGATIVSISRFDSNKTFYIGLSLSVISLLISFILVIIFHKFQRHNRISGYCMLLSQENFTFRDEDEEKNVKNIFLWDLSLNYFRNFRKDVFDADQPSKIDEIISQYEINIDKELFYKIRKFLRANLSNKDNLFSNNFGFFASVKGFMIILNGVIGGYPVSNSWSFPPYGATVLMITSSLFLILGTVLIIDHIIELFNNWDFPNYFLYAVLLLIFLRLKYIIYSHHLRRIHNLMNGSNTVESFCIQFLIIRNILLNKNRYDIKRVEYSDAILEIVRRNEQRNYT